MTPIKLSSAMSASSPTTTSVALVLAAKPNLAQTDELQITAADLTDSLGRALDGNDDGQPGGNFVATFTKNGLSFGQPSVRADAVKLSAAAVDAVLRERAGHGPLRPLGEKMAGAQMRGRLQDRASDH